MASISIKKTIFKIIILLLVLITVYLGYQIFVVKIFDSQKPYNSYEILLEYKPSYKRNINPTLKAKLDLCIQFGKNVDEYLGVDDKTLYLKYFLNSLFFNCTLESLETFLNDYERICDIVYAYGDSEKNIKQGLQDLCKEYDLKRFNYVGYGTDAEMTYAIKKTFEDVQWYLETNGYKSPKETFDLNFRSVLDNPLRVLVSNQYCIEGFYKLLLVEDISQLQEISDCLKDINIYKKSPEDMYFSWATNPRVLFVEDDVAYDIIMVGINARLDSEYIENEKYVVCVSLINASDEQYNNRHYENAYYYAISKGDYEHLYRILNEYVSSRNN